MMMGRVECSLVSWVVSQSRISLYVWCPWGVYVCGMYEEIARSWDPVFGVSRAAARYGWRVAGIVIGFILVYAFLSMASMVPAEARFVFLSYRVGLYTSL